METVVGIFDSKSGASIATRALRARGFSPDRLQLLVPGDAADIEALIATDEAEQPGVGRALGGVTGGAVGASVGLGVGAVIASLALPGVGAVTAIGLAAAALFGAGGAAAGLAAGGALEDKSTQGLPKDEMYLYEDALLHGRSVVFVIPLTDDEAKAAHEILVQSGAESIDAARESFWVGIRDAEMQHYESSESGASFSTVEGAYRRGYLAGLSGRTATEGGGTNEEKDAFRTGYERGRARNKSEAAVAAIR